MHHPKHLYATGITTGLICGLVSGLTVYSSMQYIASKNLDITNPVVKIVATSLLAGALIGLSIAFIVHQISK